VAIATRARDELGHILYLFLGARHERDGVLTHELAWRVRWLGDAVVGKRGGRETQWAAQVLGPTKRTSIGERWTAVEGYASRFCIGHERRVKGGGVARARGDVIGRGQRVGTRVRCCVENPAVEPGLTGI
jgi:hypothetical protein